MGASVGEERPPAPAASGLSVRWLVVIAVVLVALAAGAGVIFSSGGASVPQGAAVGRTAPRWAGSTITGSRLSSGAERGRWVVLNFFATWCVPCQKETPQLVHFVADPPPVGGGVRVVGVLYGDSAAAARAFEATHGMTWPIVNDSSSTISSAYDVLGLPQSFVISPNGTLVRRLFGGVTAAELDRIIDPRSARGA
jgi:peroxiredoxin